MNDTPESIRIKQFEIVNSIPLKRRITMLFDLTELSMQLIRNRLKQTNPGLSEPQIKKELFKIMYKSDFDIDTLNGLAEAIGKSYTTL